MKNNITFSRNKIPVTQTITHIKENQGNLQLFNKSNQQQWT